MMRQIELLVAMLIIYSVSGRGIYKLREAAETEPIMDDNTKPERRQAPAPCGRIQIPLSKRDEEQVGSNDTDQSDHLDKILGGSDVRPGQVPWHVNIYYQGVRSCAGAIINEYWVLTSATCLYHCFKKDIRLVVGDHQLSVNESWQQTYRVRRIVIHNSYERSFIEYDIAIIKVKKRNGHAIRFNNYVQPICLPEADERPPVNTNLTVSGWGDPPSTGPHNQSSDTLKTAVLPVVSSDLCFHRGLCVLRTDIGICDGDFSAPATYQSGNSHVLAGIIKGIYDCKPRIDPIRITDVSLYRNWIDDRIDAHGSPTHRVIPSRID